MFKDVVSRISDSPSSTAQMVMISRRLKRDRLMHILSVVAVTLMVGLQILTITAPPQSSKACTECAGKTSSISSKFNEKSASAGNHIWFTAVGKIEGAPNGTQLRFNQSSIKLTINGGQYVVGVPNGLITFSSSATQATTTYDISGGQWVTTVPVGYSGNVLLSAVAWKVPSGVDAKKADPVTWTGNFSGSRAGVAVDWQMAAAVYPGSFPSPSSPSNYNLLGVKPIDGAGQNPYANSDQAGTPENYKSTVLAGAMGEGGSDCTGGHSPAVHVNANYCPPPSPSPSPSHTPTPTPTPSVSHTPSPSPSPSVSHTPTPSPSPSPSWSPTPSHTPSPTPSTSHTPTPSPSPSSSVTPTPSGSHTPSPTPSGSTTPSLSVSPAPTASAATTPTPDPIFVRKSKRATNVTHSMQAQFFTANPGDIINYTLVTTNVGTKTITYQVVDELNSVLTYADAIDTNGGVLSGSTLSWPPVTIAAGASITNTFQVRIKNPIPANPANLTNIFSGTLMMDNVYGDQIEIKLPGSLPATGSGPMMILILIVAALILFFYFRNRQLAAELRLLTNDGDMSSAEASD